MPKQLLVIDSSILGEASVTRHASSEIVSHLQQSSPDLIVHRRDLAAEPVAHLSGGYLAAVSAPTSHEHDLQHDLALSAQVLEEFLAADVVVIGAPMYNFTVPTQLKAWIDRILVAGKTFRYTESGAQGLVTGKRIIVALARGSFYGVETPLAALDHQEPLLKGLFGFIGVTDIDYIRVEGVAISPEQRAKSLELAQSDIRALRPV